jgi:hypothetical protein
MLSKRQHWTDGVKDEIVFAIENSLFPGQPHKDLAHAPENGCPELFRKAIRSHVKTIS